MSNKLKVIILFVLVNLSVSSAKAETEEKILSDFCFYALERQEKKLLCLLSQDNPANSSKNAGESPVVPEPLYRRRFGAEGREEATMESNRGGSCEEQEKRSQVTLLIPHLQWTPVTISERPTLLFYLDKKSSVPISIGLSAPGQRKALWVTELNPEPGIVSVELPESVALEINKEYVWSVILLCEPERLAQNPYALAAFKRVDVGAETLPSEPAQRVIWFAQNEIWHEAIALAYQLYQNEPSNSYYRSLFSKLIEEAGLSPSVKVNRIANFN